MAYNSKVTREDANALIPEQKIINEIIEGTVAQSKVLQMFTKLPNMTSKTAKMPVLNMLPEAYWVSGDDGLKQTTNAMWKNKFIVAEELAVIVPIPEAVLDDSEYDIWGQIKPRLIEAFGKKIDQAIITGVDKPTAFREALIPSIITAGADVAPSTNNMFTQISDAMGKVEESGFNVNGLLGGVELKKAFRNGLLDTTGQPLANSEVTELARVYADNGAWDNTKAKFIVGDFSQAVYAIRQDITFKLLDQGVITDANGNVVLNLAQQDCVALRAVMRLGWEIPNPINALNSNEETRFPFALVQPATAPTEVNVEFTVMNDANTPVAVSGASVTFGGQTKRTGSNGKATFNTLGNTSSLYEVKKSGKKTVYGKVDVTTTAVNKTITLVAED